MCILIHTLAGTALPTKDKLQEAWRCNADGGGLMWVEDGGVQIYKSMDERAFLTTLEQTHARVGNSTPITAHFRISTSGTVDEFNCHPFRVSPTMAFAHNGVLFSPPIKERRSDTHIFRDEVVQKLPDRWWENDALWMLINEYTLGNKLVFMWAGDDGQARTRIVHEKSGHWDEGVWYSNTSYRPYGKHADLSKTLWRWDDPEYVTSVPATTTQAPTNEMTSDMHEHEAAIGRRMSKAERKAYRKWWQQHFDQATRSENKVMCETPEEGFCDWCGDPDMLFSVRYYECSHELCLACLSSIRQGRYQADDLRMSERMERMLDEYESLNPRTTTTTTTTNREETK